MKRTLSFLLTLALLLGLVPASALAAQPDASVAPQVKPAEIVTGQGETVPVEESWEEVYPYGAFLFANGEVNLTEGGETAEVPLYRLGGTRGRATAYVYYSPAVMQVNQDRVSYGSALGCNDVYITVEDALPIAAYQPVGKPAEPERTDAAIRNAPYTGQDGEPGDRELTVDVQAESWQWYVLADGVWQEVEDATEPAFTVSGDYLEEYDFRCVFTRDGVRYCTDSVKGAPYEKQPEEVLPDMPEDLDLAPARTFSPLEMDPEDPYAGYVFAVTFADGEWVKYLRVTALEDSEAEALEFATFTLADHLGGALYDAAGTLTLSVTDNEPPEPFSIGFTEADYTADKAGGAAYVTLKRTGGTQTMVTVDYATADGAARAGRDYQAVTGTAAFYAGVDEAVIEIPLIDDGIASDAPLSFRLTLGELRGDGLGLGTLTRTETEVSLTNSGKGGNANLVTQLFDDEAEDVSGSVPVAETVAAPVDDSAVTGTVVELPEAEVLRGEIEGLDSPEVTMEDSGQLMTYNYGRVRFSSTGSGGYWSDTASIAGQASNDYTGWNAGSAYGNGWQVTGKSPQNARLNIPHLAQMFREFRGRFEYELEFASGWTQFWYGTEFVYGTAYLVKGGGMERIGNQASYSDGTAHYTASKTYTANWDIGSDVEGLMLALERYDAHDADTTVYSRITSGSLTRRVMYGDLNLRVHTANDGESGNGNVPTAPEGAAALLSSSSVYSSMKPAVTVVPGAGGVNSYGRLYVGSQIKVSLQTTDSYKPFSDDSLSAALYLTDSKGRVVRGPEIRRSDDDFFITLRWDGMTEADVNEDYTVNVLMTRVQGLTLDLSPSVPRKTDSDGNPTAAIDPSRIGEGWNAFWQSRPGVSTDNVITLGYSKAQSTAPHFSREIVETALPQSALDSRSGSQNGVYSLGSFENLQYINFNRADGDRIVLNGRTYKGNERIWLTVEDLAFGSLKFYYYNQAYLSAESIMSAAVTRVELYLDGDGDGKISGSYNGETGYFNLSSGTADRFLMMLDENGSYDELTFQPVELADGKYGEYFLKIFYTMTPRSLMAPADGKGGTAQVLPALTTTITEPSVYSSLTEEQQSYRYLLSGLGADGQRTSDGHPMYGAAATAPQFVDVPLGGDRSPVEHTGDGEQGYTFTWDPQYRGNLLYAFSEPDPIYIEHSLAGDNIPLADVTFDKAKGMVTDSAGRENLNGYLGSFVADTTLALCVTEQRATADSLRANPGSADTLQPESTELIRRSASPDASYLGQVDSPGLGNASMDPAGSGNTYIEQMPDYGMNLPVNTVSLLSYAKVLLNKDEVILSVSIPLFTEAGANNEGDFKKMRIPQTITTPTAKQLDEVNGMFHGKDGLIDALQNNGNKLKDGKLTSKKYFVTVSFAMVFKWKYDSVENEYFFKEFALGGSVALGFRYTLRFAPFPLLYFYLAVNLGATLTTGGTVVRREKERDLAYVKVGETKNLPAKASTTITTKYQNLILQFTGRLFIEVLDSDGKRMEGTNSGFVKSDGGQKMTVRLSGNRGTELDEPKTVRITALSNSDITYLNVIESVSSELKWSGVTFNPSLNLEAGLGLGVDMFKVEACARFVASVTFTYGAYNADKDDYSGTGISAASIALSITVRVVILFFSDEADAIGVAAKYSSKNGWTYTWNWFGNESKLQGDEEPGFLRLPEDVSAKASVYSPQLHSDEAALAAYEADDPTVPFQLSGYNSSVSAFRLADGLALGSDYQVIPVGGENYVLYTYARAGAGALDGTKLVLSRLVSTGGSGSVGLVNPLDDVVPTEGSVRNGIPYILVDTVDGSDDGTGDLEFQGRLDEDGKTIRVAWVSYAAPAALAGEESPRQVLQNAAKNTVVKTAAFDTSGKTGFTAPSPVSGQPGAAVSRPAALDGRVTAYVRSEHFTAGELDGLAAEYAGALAALGFDPEDSDPSLAYIGKSRLENQRNLWDTLGKRNRLCVSVDGKITEKVLPEGQVVDNVAFTRSGDSYYAAYTTRETVLTGSDGLPVSGQTPANIRTVQRLFLDRFTVEGDTVTWAGGGKSALLRTLWDYEDNRALSDGIYSAGALTPYDNPYFSNLQFLNAALGDALTGGSEDFQLMEEGATEDFLLFEMNGCTYVIRQGSLESITAAEHTGAIIPFFAADPDANAEGTNSAAFSTGRAEATIGADGAGGLAAVYVSTVPNTTNNALFMSRYDPATASWGKGVLLAMNHMDVYEDAAAGGWTPEETAEAYLGRRRDYGKGGMDQFTFTAPQIALGLRGGESAASNAEDGAVPNAGGSGQGTETTLLVLTQGNLSYLEQRESGGERYLTVDPQGSGAYPSGAGIYAISYGMGHQTLGKAELSFLTCDFTAGAELNASLTFTNTGDVSIRGSKDRDQAVTVTLSAAGPGLPETRLIRWTVTENILPGQRVELSGGFTLPVTLPEGAGFSLTVSEGSYYEALGGKPYTATLSGLLTVEKKPELGFEEASAALSGLDAGAVRLDGNGSAVLEVDFTVGNRGNADAADVYVQLTYDTGETDGEGNPVYRPLDISDNTLTVGKEEPLAALQALIGPGYGATDGVVVLGSLQSGYGRRVQGTLTLPPDKYFVSDGLALGLRMEIFSAADGGAVWEGDVGVHLARHGEYNEKNNVLQTTVASAVTFTLPDRLLLAKGSLLRLPVRYLSATGSRTPDILVAEYPDEEDNDGVLTTRFQRMDQNLDLLYYEEGSYSAGAGSGTVVVRAAKEGNGYIRILDRRTNSYQDIPFQVTQESQGTDIVPGNGRFTFRNRDGSVYVPGGDPGKQSWSLLSDVEAWGRPRQDGTYAAPYRGTLMRGEPGSGFSFETEAESVTLYLDGYVSVSSDLPGAQVIRGAAYGGDLSQATNSVFVSFGPNPENKIHTVTVTVLGTEPASFDRVVEHYSGDMTGEAMASADQAPKIYWEQDFPKKDSLPSNTYYSTLFLNIVSTAPISRVNIWGTALYSKSSTRVTPYWYQCSVLVRRNGDFTVDAVDTNGNHCIQHINVDWWPETASLQAGEDLPLPTEEELAAMGRRWMEAELVEGDTPAIRVRIDESAPYDGVIVLIGEAEDIINLAGSDSDFDAEALSYVHLMEPGEEREIPVQKNGINLAVAYCFSLEELFREDDPEYMYTIEQPDGTVDTYDAREEYSFNLSVFQVDGIKTPEEQPTPAVPGTDVTPVPDDYVSPRSPAGNTAPAPTAEPADREADRSDALLAAFSDLEKDAWFAKAVRWAAGEGVVNGYDGNSFAPGDPVTREQMAAILYRLAGKKGLVKPGDRASLLQFNDRNAVSAWATEAVEWAVGTGLIGGMGNGTVSPGTCATRAQAATLLMRFAALEE